MTFPFVILPTMENKRVWKWERNRVKFRVKSLLKLYKAEKRVGTIYLTNNYSWTQRGGISRRPENSLHMISISTAMNDTQFPPTDNKCRSLALKHCVMLGFQLFVIWFWLDAQEDLWAIFKEDKSDKGGLLKCWHSTKESGVVSIFLPFQYNSNGFPPLLRQWSINIYYIKMLALYKYFWKSHRFGTIHDTATHSMSYVWGANTFDSAVECRAGGMWWYNIDIV